MEIKEAQEIKTQEMNGTYLWLPRPALAAVLHPSTFLGS
jgi:hypothetical protein